MATTESAWPFNSQNNSESDWSKLIGSMADTGVRQGLNLTAGSGMKVIVALGSAIIQGFFYELTGDPKELTIGASHATLTRRDYIILKLDLAANTITALVKPGTAFGSTGTLPALTQNSSVWEHPIGIITVPGGASNIVIGNIQELLAGTGLRVIPYANNTERPDPVTSRALGVNTTTKKLELWVSGAWNDLTPTVTWAGITGKPTEFAPSAHTHAQSEITGLVAALAAKAALVHDHDDRYYQESEIDTLLLGKAAASHTHTIANITSLQSTLDAKAALSHAHAAGDITTGTLAIARGGTGQTTAAAALSALGGASASALASTTSTADKARDGDMSINVWVRDVGGMTRQAVWMGNNGLVLFGYASSLRARKQDIRPAADASKASIAADWELTPEMARSIVASLFRYRWAVAAERAGKRDEAGNPLRAHIEFGVIADDLHAAGLWPLVSYDDDGEPRGVHYELLGLVALQLAQWNADAIDEERAKREALETRVDELAGVIATLTKGAK